ncbi:cilia- and flagella-associated protein 36 [Oratosquilla oratoria]|uniref:cilia- and flagella-associated protein 36 n=1 Tax=Oratosquilla oratoria TaxID=337810 RepID=UPI003F7743E6
MSEDSWVFDSLVGFLRGPVWNVPILTFIEHKSLIFEASCEDESEYGKIHEEYKNLVDFMLGSYMEDIGITPEQFEAACGKASGHIKSQFHQTLFEQVWAADDYEIFKRMMIQKNIELQLQALELLQQRHGIIPESYTPGDGDEMSPEERAIMEQVIKKSLEEHKSMQEGMDQETQDLEKAIVESNEQKSQLEAENQREREMLEKALKMSLSDNSYSAPSAPTVVPQTTIDPEELRKRQEYLKSQRDRLLALKKQEREKQLAEFEHNSSQKRPKSSRAARRALSGNTIDAQTLKVRKALAARLKAEVIDG